MKCHYEVLNIPRTADASEIKTSYRKLALKCHPDKNLNDPEGAKQQFQLVQQAYEVLSDPHERTWYDNHRDQILRGGHTEYEDNSLDVFQYFTVSCYKGFGDDPGSFYSVYQEVFDKLASEEIEFMDTEEEYDEIPKFGTCKSSYEDTVGPFYAYWQSFCTKKSYAWLCPHNISEVRDRRVLKVIEKENKKIVTKARKERNEEIRNLVAFVRKRDKRVQAYKKYLEEKSELNKAKQEKIRIEQILKRKKELEEQCRKSNHKDDGYEEQLRQLEGAYAGSSDDDYSDYDEGEELQPISEVEEGVDNLGIEQEEESYNDDLYCVACNKSFKNHSSFSNHESSKKHKENIKKLVSEMHNEENTFDDNSRECSVGSDESDIEIDEEKEIGEEKENELNPDPVVNNVIKDDSPETISIKTKKKTKRNITVERKSESEAENKVNILDTNEDDDNDDWRGKPSKKNKKVKSKSNKTAKVKEEQSQTETKPEEIFEKQNKPVQKTNKSSSNDNNETILNVDLNHVCVTCHAQFNSKNKLFAHLKKLNHGVYIPKEVNGGEKPQKRKKK